MTDDYSRYLDDPKIASYLEELEGDAHDLLHAISAGQYPRITFILGKITGIGMKFYARNYEIEQTGD